MSESRVVERGSIGFANLSTAVLSLSGLGKAVTVGGGHALFGAYTTTFASQKVCRPRNGGGTASPEVPRWQIYSSTNQTYDADWNYVI